MSKILLRILNNKWFRILTVGILTIATFITAGIFCFDLYIGSKLEDHFGTDGMKWVRSFLDAPLPVPDDWFEVKPFSEALLDADREFHAQWLPLEWPFLKEGSAIHFFQMGERLREGESLSDEEWKSIRPMLDKYCVPLESFSNLVRLPDYEIAAVGITTDTRELDFILVYMCVLKLCSVQSFALAREGNWNEAFEIALDMIRIAARHPALDIVRHDAGMRFLELGSKSIAVLASRCEDARLLEQVLQEMNALDSRVNPKVLVSDRLFLPYHVAQMIAGAREARRNGLPVMLYPGMTGRELVRQTHDLTVYYPQKHALSPPQTLAEVRSRKSTLRRMKGSAERAYGIHQIEKRIKAMAAIVSPTLPAPPLPSDSIYWWQMQSVSEGLGLLQRSEEIYLSSSMMRAYKKAEEEHNRALVEFDLARLAIASRIVELETGARPSDYSSLAPRFFSEPLINPFTEKPYEWDAAVGRFSGIPTEDHD